MIHPTRKPKKMAQMFAPVLSENLKEKVKVLSFNACNCDMIKDTETIAKCMLSPLSVASSCASNNLHYD